MIPVVAGRGSEPAGRLVASALGRALGRDGARPFARGDVPGDADVLALVDAPGTVGEDLAAWLRARPRKALLFGAMPDAIARAFGAADATAPDLPRQAARAAPAPVHGASESAAAIVYGGGAARLGGRPWRRAMERFDFADEWNNLGFGAVRADGGIWAVACRWQAPAGAEIAAIVTDASHGSYAALLDAGAGALLWFNRPVGPIDSFEWRLVETFLASFGADRGLPCVPVLSEVPFGHDAAVTMRLDCDEDLASARPLWRLYGDARVPFSLAVLTALLDDPAHHGLLTEVAASGGSILSHSATHAENWGGSEAAAEKEARCSAHALACVTGRTPRHAVSPFHQTPPAALRALARSGYEGCIGGIIRNDPEFLMARGGAVDGLPPGFVGHSQQCMLHGDCMLASGDPIAVYREAFDLAHQTMTLFGYLDHPFSQRYAYGWPDEATRCAMHEAFLGHIRKRAAAPIFLSEDDALDFLRFKSQARCVRTGRGWRVETGCPAPAGLELAVDYRGDRLRAAALDGAP